MFEKGSGLLDDIGVRLLQLEQNVGEGVGGDSLEYAVIDLGRWLLFCC